MEYSNEVKTLLLKVIKFNGDLRPIIKLGFEYSQIVELIQDEIAVGNVQQKNGEMFITEEGNKLIDSLVAKRNGGSDKWIEPEIESRIAKFPKDFIFLPNRKELSF